MTPPRAALGTVLATLILASFASAQGPQPGPEERPAIPAGELQILGAGGVTRGACPLKHTDVVANVVGVVGRTRVKQTFHNPLNEKIEAVYVFPLPGDAAVDEMVMTVGDRRVVGRVKPREEAQAVYQQAKAAGHVAGLLDQERPNVFSQSVANIEPGAQVVVEIAYVETVKQEEGWYEYVFPMVVGPRYVPGAPTGRQGEGVAQDTTEVPDASRLSPQITPKGTRAGHDVSLTLTVDAGVPIQGAECRTHPIVTDAPKRPELVRVWLKHQDTIPNKDFVYRYRTAGEKVGDAILTHKDARGHFFTLVLQPPQKVLRKDAVGRELIFVLDTSGSMSGFPITQAKFVIARAIDSMGPQDTFNLITFSGDTSVLWDEPKPNTPQNREEAQSFLASRQGRGGTEMMKAIEAALVKPARIDHDRAGPEPVRVVAFLTDGYVGNDFEIIDAVKKNAGTTRVFSFGIGNSVNRFLLDGMAHAGRGEVEYVTLDANSQAAAERFYRRIDAPVLTDVSIDFGNLPLADVYPKLVPDLFSDRPVLVHGRLTGDVPAGATVTLKGNTAAGPFERKVGVKPAPPDASHEALASLWARSKVQDLMMKDLAALQSGNFPQDLKNAVTALGTEFRLMTQFTSFVAVEELTITRGGKATTISVPVEMPDGVSYEGILGERDGAQPMALARLGRAYAARGGAMRGRGLSVAGGAGYGGFGTGAAPQQTQFGLSPARPAATAPAPAAGGVTGAGATAANGPAATPTAAAKSLAEAKSLDAAAAAPADAPAPDPLAKLHESLRGLAEKVDKEGTNGSLTAGGVTVENHKVDVMVYLSDASPKTLDALKRLGFAIAAESKSVRLLVGSIDVRKLADLAKVDAVVSVKPVG